MSLLLTQPHSAILVYILPVALSIALCPLPATSSPLPPLFRVLQIESKNWLLLYMSPDNGHNNLYAPPRSTSSTTSSNVERAGVDATMGRHYFDESEEVAGGESKQSSSKGTCFMCTSVVWVVNAIDM